VARSLGGSDHIRNIVPACRECQERKANRTLWADFVPVRPHPALLLQFPPKDTP
jgi:hypothetical protein